MKKQVIVTVKNDTVLLEFLKGHSVWFREITIEQAHELKTLLEEELT